MKHLNEYNEYVTDEMQHFFDMCRYKDTEEVQNLLDKGIHPHKKANYHGDGNESWYPVEIAAQKGAFAILKLLFADERVDVRVSNDYVLTAAADRDYIKMLMFILEDGRCDPNAENNEAIRFASAEGQLTVVTVLLEDGRCDPSAEDSEALKLAVINEHIEIVKLLLADPRVDPAAENNKTLMWAVSKQNEEIVDLLLTDKRVLDRIGQIPFEKMKPMLRGKLVRLFDLDNAEELIEILPLMK